MAFWVILIKIAKIILEARKLANALKGLSSGKLVQSLVIDFIVGEVRNGLVKAGVPPDSIKFVEQAHNCLEWVLDATAKELDKIGIQVTLAELDESFQQDRTRLLRGLSVGNGKGAERHQTVAADPVLLHRGEFERSSLDLFVRGAGADLMLRRVYRSGADYLGPFGRGWDHSFNLRLVEKDAFIVTRMTGNLSQTTFVRHPRFGEAGYNYFAPEFGIHDVLKLDANGTYQLQRPGGGSITYELAGPREHRARSIHDAAGNRIDFEYDTENRLLGVYGNGPHRYLRFFYGARNLVERVEDHTGRQCIYSYDEYGALTSVEQWTEVAGRPHLVAETYEYTAVGDGRRLARVSDEKGRVIVENEYETQRTSDTLGYVRAQYTEHGPTSFIYERLAAKPSTPLAAVDEPTLRVFETPPDGHVIERVFNEAGNELLRREDFAEGGRIRTALIRTRYNEDGAVVARMDPEGGLTQFLFGREHANLGPWAEVRTTLSDLTADNRMAFGNQLAKVERGRAIGEFDRAAEQEQWIAALPAVELRSDGEDAVIKQVFDPHTQVLISTSDVRATVSPDPLHVESAPPGTASYDPGHPLAQAHRRLQTIHQYTPAGHRVKTIYPHRTRPASIGGPPLNPITEVIAAWDARGRPLTWRDRRGYFTYWEYYPDSAVPAEGAKAGYARQELRPHIDWIFGPDFPPLLEVQRIGSWTSTPLSFLAAGGAPASIRLDLHCQRIELWPSSNGTTTSGSPAAVVTIDGVVQGVWNQLTSPSYVIDGLAPGPHLLDISAAMGGLSLGRVLGHVAFTFEVDVLGRVTAETDPRGVTTRTDYDSLDRVILRTRGTGAAMIRQRSSFDRDGDLEWDEKEWSDSAGAPIAGGAVRTTYTNNARGLLSLEMTRAPGHPDRRVTRHYHDLRGELVAARNGRGVMTRWRVDTLGRRVQETRAACTIDQATTVITYDRCGRVLQERDPEGAIRLNGALIGGSTRSGYDARGRLQFATDPLGHITLTRHDLAGRVVVVQLFGRRADGTFELVERHDTEYDEHGDTFAVKNAIITQPIPAADPFAAPDAAFLGGIGNGSVTTTPTSYELDADGRQTRIVDAAGVTRRTYDPQGRVVEERLTSGRRVVRMYDSAGNPSRTYAFDPPAADGPPREAAAFLETYHYDDHGRRIELQDAYGSKWQEVYDTLGNVQQSVDPLGRRIKFRHNAFGQEIERTEGLTTGPHASPATTARSYDHAGNLVAIVDALGRQFTFSMDALDRRISWRNASHPGDSGSSFVYDRCSRLVREIDRNGLVSHHRYDLAGRRVRTEYDASGIAPAHSPSPQSATFVAIDYDARGSTRRVENDWTVVTQVRDSRGLLLEERTELKLSGGAGTPMWRVAQSFDDAAARIGLVFPSGRAVSYARDGASRVTEIENTFTPPGYPGSALTQGTTILARYRYAGGRWTRADYPTPNAALTIEYDGRGQPCERIVTDNATMQTRWRQQTLLDAARQTAIETATTPAGSRSRHLALDLLGRLVGYSDGPPTWINSATQAPPAVPIAPATPAAQAAIDALRPPGPTTNTIDLDSVGNRLSSREGAGSALVTTPDTDNRYTTVGPAVWTYDPEGRLLTDTKQQYRYDAAGLLAEELELGGAGVRGVAFLRDGLGRIVAALTPNSVHHFAYLDRAPLAHWNENTSSEFTPGRQDEGPVHIASANEDVWVITDALRTPRLLLRRGGVPTDAVFDYRPYGAPISPAVSVPLLDFAGMLRFPGSSVLHTSHRSYLPTLGRFLQQDPAGFADSTNRYVYARNNPVDLFDPLGLQSFSSSDLLVFEFLERVAHEIGLDPAHSAEHAVLQGQSKHLEFQFAAAHPTSFAEGHPLHGYFKDAADADRIAPEIWVNDKGVIIAVDTPPAGAPANSRTIDVGIVKKEIQGGKNAIIGKRAEDVLDYAVDYKTGNAQLVRRLELEALIGYKPVVKLTGKVGELAKSLSRRLAAYAAIRVTKKIVTSKAAKWGLKKVGQSLPVVGFFVTYAANSQASEAERIGRSVAGEIPVFPFVDLETLYDAYEASGEMGKEYQWGQYNPPTQP